MPSTGRYTTPPASLAYGTLAVAVTQKTFPRQRCWAMQDSRAHPLVSRTIVLLGAFNIARKPSGMGRWGRSEQRIYLIIDASGRECRANSTFKAHDADTRRRDRDGPRGRGPSLSLRAILAQTQSCTAQTLLPYLCGRSSVSSLAGVPEKASLSMRHTRLQTLCKPNLPLLSFKRRPKQPIT